MKRAALTFLLIFILALSCTLCLAESENLVKNAGFEEASGQIGSGWDTYSWENTGILKLDDKQKYQGSKSAFILNSKASDTRYKQTIKVKENTTYKLSCMIKTENVGTETKGANISVDGLLETSVDIKGSNGKWEYVELYGKTSKKQNSFIVTLGLGGYGSLNSGQAWFDDVKVEEVKDVPEGKKIINLYKDTSENTASNNSPEIILSAITAVLAICFGIALALYVARERKTKGSEMAVNAGYNRLDLKDIGIMLCMTLLYASFTFFNLGSLKAPETAWLPKEKGQSLILDLGKEADISRISYFWGLGSGKYKLEYLDKNNNFQAINMIESDNYDDIFTWNYIDVAIQAKQIKIIVEEEGAELKELAIFERGNTNPLENIRILEGKAGSDLKDSLNLFDEQRTASYLPTYMNGMYFDEIYHARAGYEYINHIQPYENTHPPLGKVFISLGIMIFGMNPFGWRIIGALFGALMIPVMYLFGRKIFKGRFYAFLAAFLIMFDFMHFTQTRIATIDTYVTLFVILMYYYMFDFFTQKTLEQSYKKYLLPLFLSGLFFGLGAASKWIAIYGAAGLALLFAAQKYGEYRALPKDNKKRMNTYMEWLKTALYCILFFIVIPAIIYLLSYIPLMLVPGNSFINVIKDQAYMLNYHSKSVLGATHSFASKWWSWPILYKPMWYFSGKSLIEGKVSTIVAMGNPAIWWPSIPAVIYGSYLAFKKSDKKLAVLIIAFIFQYVPWIYVKRLTFIYHFFSSIPFVILIIIYIIENFVEKYYNTSNKTLVKYLIGTYMVLVVALFVMFYPAISGAEASSSYIDGYLKWFKGVWFF